jgi:hypothetical protein
VPREHTAAAGVHRGARPPSRPPSSAGATQRLGRRSLCATQGEAPRLHARPHPRPRGRPAVRRAPESRGRCHRWPNVSPAKRERERERERVRVCVCVCVCEREREGERTNAVSEREKCTHIHKHTKDRRGCVRPRRRSAPYYVAATCVCRLPWPLGPSSLAPSA